MRATIVMSDSALVSVARREHRLCGPPRSLLPMETRLIAALLEHTHYQAMFDGSWRTAWVRDLQPYGTKSILFVTPDGRRRTYDRAIAIADCLDIDDEPISIALNIDQRGELYELDLWKKNLNALRQYPTPEQLHRAVARPQHTSLEFIDEAKRRSSTMEMPSTRRNEG